MRGLDETDISVVGMSARGTLDVPETLDACLVVLAVPDDVIADVARSLAEAWRRPQAVARDGVDSPRQGAREPSLPDVVHCSGALDAQPLSALASLGCRVGAWHPLQAFPDRGTSLQPGVTWAVTAEDALAADLEAVTRSLGGVPRRLPAAAKTRYHAAAALSANYTVTLLWHASQLLHSCGFTEEEALDALLPLLRSTLDGVESARLPQGLTGPLVRGDLGTLGRHLTELAASPEVLEVYRALGRATLPILHARGISDVRREAAADLLAGSGANRESAADERL